MLVPRVLLWSGRCKGEGEEGKVGFAERFVGERGVEELGKGPLDRGERRDSGCCIGGFFLERG